MARSLCSPAPLRTATIVTLFTLALMPVAAFAFDVPPNDGFVTDTAGILKEEDRVGISKVLQDYQTSTSNEIAVLIVKSLNGESIADAAVDVLRKWGVGTKEKSNGILLLIAYDDHKIFLTTGYGLEGVVPDIVTKGIIDQEMTPLFRKGDYAGGIRAAIEALMKHIGGEYKADRYTNASSDGGGPWAFLFFAGIIIFQAVVSFLGQTKSWWLGGVLGAIVGFFLALIFTWWWSVPLLVFVGLLIDYIASKTYKPGKRRRGGGGGGMWLGGGGFGGGGGGGFRGFGGGSGGGGGAGGSW
ncbi:MAG: TPM domain-containing protein [Candidatus Peribacteraceae bacterium]|nr:TPM domain-containing protein [Candidatus Peribacteraceae bacterium]MDD5074648.1 TPM domain-containing protein [Candidatus Peribacteraceae bacterium]